MLELPLEIIHHIITVSLPVSIYDDRQRLNFLPPLCRLNSSLRRFVQRLLFARPLLYGLKRIRLFVDAVCRLNQNRGTARDSSWESASCRLSFTASLVKWERMTRTVFYVAYWLPVGMSKKSRSPFSMRLIWQTSLKSRVSSLPRASDCIADSPCCRATQFDLPQSRLPNFRIGGRRDRIAIDAGKFPVDRWFRPWRVGREWIPYYRRPAVIKVLLRS